MLNIPKPKGSALAIILASCVAIVPSWASGQGQAVLVEGNGITITKDDVLAELQRIPPEGRQTVLAQPDTVKQLVTSLYQHRVLAAEAERSGLDKDPVLQAVVRIAQDRILADARLVAIDTAALPDSAALDALAMDIYRANTARFRELPQIRVRHILISGKNEASRGRAERLLAQLKGGANFDELAKQQSADTGSAARGGDLGFFGRGRMAPAFESAAFALQQPGDVSDIVESNLGYHIIRLDEKRNRGFRPFEEVKAELRNELSAGMVKANRDKEVQRMMRDARFHQEALQTITTAR